MPRILESAGVSRHVIRFRSQALEDVHSAHDVARSRRLDGLAVV